MRFICNEFGNFLAISNPGMAQTAAKASNSEDTDYLPELADWTDDEVTTFYEEQFSLFIYLCSVTNKRYCFC